MTEDELTHVHVVCLLLGKAHGGIRAILECDDEELRKNLEELRAYLDNALDKLFYQGTVN